MKKFLPILFIIFSCAATAQNYQCLQSGAKHYFTNGNGYLRGISIDSVITTGDTTVYYPYHTPRGSYSINPILDSNGGSWLGGKVLQLSDGEFIFDDDWNDSVIIQTQANLSDSWIFYQDTSTLYYRATVTLIDTMTFLGVIDTVKTITINAYNGASLAITDPVNGFQILLSKNHGFVKVFDLYTFPYHLPGAAYVSGLDYYLDYVIQYSYTGLPTQTNSIFSLINFIDPSYEQLYQWNIGDVYEYSVCNDYFEHYGGCIPVEHYYMDTITAINITASGISYNFNGTVSTYVSPWPISVSSPPYGPYVYNTTSNSGILTYDTTLLIDTALMPEEFNNRNLYSYLPNDNSYCTISALYTILGFGNNGYITGILFNPLFEAYDGPSIYKSPLGLLSSFSSSVDMGNIVYSQNLIYDERGSESCGDLLIPSTSINEIQKSGNSIILSPNPSQNDLTITSSEKINTIIITNSIGQTVYTNTFNTEWVKIDVSGWASGVYFVKINGTEVRKFVKE